jgi:hypothetical protein
LPALAPLAVLPGLRFVERRRIQLEEDGITFRGWLGRRRHVPWARISELRHHGRTATFRANGEVNLLDDRTPRWHRLFREIERHVLPEPEPADRPAEVPAEAVAQSLGITVDGVLTCRPGYDWTMAVLALVFAFPISFLPAGAFFVFVRVLLLSFSAFMLWAGDRQRNELEVSADVNGLARGRGRVRSQVPWSAVRSIDDGPVPFVLDWYRNPRPDDADHRQLVVTTDEGVIRFLRNDPGGAQLEAGIRALISARDAGHALPSGAPLSDAALSQARLSGEGDAERGLSRVGEGGEVG